MPRREGDWSKQQIEETQLDTLTSTLAAVQLSLSIPVQ